jgi:hypothetical protein
LRANSSHLRAVSQTIATDSPSSDVADRPGPQTEAEQPLRASERSSRLSQLPLEGPSPACQTVLGTPPGHPKPTALASGPPPDCVHSDPGSDYRAGVASYITAVGPTPFTGFSVAVEHALGASLQRYRTEPRCTVCSEGVTPNMFGRTDLVLCLLLAHECLDGREVVVVRVVTT